MSNDELRAMIASLRRGGAGPDATSRLVAAGEGAFDLLAEAIVKDMAIDELERLEGVLKGFLREQLVPGRSGAQARHVAEGYRRIGLLLKYKSYAIKASSPLGYSVFLQRPREGFSFQRHRTHKLELFHVLAAQEGAFVFLCRSQEWTRSYVPDEFAAWLAGAPDRRYERFRVEPHPGDVFAVSRLDTVHTVVGCVLEEFATISTDMVDRLHDPNRGRPLPAEANRAAARGALASLPVPPSSRQVTIRGGRREVKALPAEEGDWGRRALLCRRPFLAVQWRVAPGAASPLAATRNRASALFCLSGTGRVVIVDQREASRGLRPSLPLARGDVIHVPPGVKLGLESDPGAALVVSEHTIAPSLALLP